MHTGVHAIGLMGAAVAHDAAAAVANVAHRQ